MPEPHVARPVRPLPVGPLVAFGAAFLAWRGLVLDGRPSSWHFFADAAAGMHGPHAPGLDLYAVHPEFQFGPLAVAIATVFEPVPRLLSRPVVGAFASLLGLVTLLLVERLARLVHPEVEAAAVRRALWWSAPLFLFAWSDVALLDLHIDDALTLTATVAAMVLVAARRPWWATVALACAVAAKPWAIVFIPLLAAVPDRWRLVRPLVAAGLAALTFLPFVLDDPRTIGALGHFTIRTAPTSGLRVLGVAAMRTPSWDRPLQLALGLLLASVIVALGRWPAVPLVALGLRLLIDPGTHHYYTVGLATAVLIWELCEHPTRIPWRTLLTVVVLEVTANTHVLSTTAGPVRFVLLLALIVEPFAPRRVRGERMRVGISGP